MTATAAFNALLGLGVGLAIYGVAFWRGVKQGREIERLSRVASLRGRE